VSEHADSLQPGSNAFNEATKESMASWPRVLEREASPTNLRRHGSMRPIDSFCSTLLGYSSTVAKRLQFSEGEQGKRIR